jgi:hypothetical protein
VIGYKREKIENLKMGKNRERNKVGVGGSPLALD